MTDGKARTIPARAHAAALAEFWSPVVLTRFNDCNVMTVKVSGFFHWHRHAETDDFFYVLDGELWIDLEEGTHRLGAGDLFVVPRGMLHRPRCEGEATILLIEPIGTERTGDDPPR
jgi:mannose-6-phosphate isomerase-like protein (cupin superfamily)